MELSDIEIRDDPFGGVMAEVRADWVAGDRGCWISVVGWGATEAVARSSLKRALDALPDQVPSLQRKTPER